MNKYIRSAAEDLTQDVFYEASKSLHRFQGPSPLSTELCSIEQIIEQKGSCVEADGCFRKAGYSVELDCNVAALWRTILQGNGSIDRQERKLCTLLLPSVEK